MDDDYTIPCPHCGDDVYDDVDQCPHCRQYISAADLKKSMPVWVVVVVLLTIGSFAMPFLWTLVATAMNR